MKSFNYKFFKENMRKSKEVLALLGVLLPLLSIIFTFLLRSVESAGTAVVTFPRMSFIAAIGVFIVPPVLAYCLFGFIFNKKKVDFYLSKPVSRKSIFVTNIIGGSVLLALLILISSLLFALLAMITDFVCPWLMILDYFVHWTVSYLFMFYVSAFAMAFAGNKVTSFVIVFLCLFYYPFATYIYKEARGTTFAVYTCVSESCPICIENEKDCQNHYENNDFYIGATEKIKKATYTTPLNFINTQKYETISVIKTFILSIAYIYVGYIAFKRRKMENNEISFINPYLHFIIKTIIFIPVVVSTMLVVSSAGSAFIPLSLLICATFYLLYDLLTMKTIYKVKLSILAFSITLIITTIGTGILINLSETKKHDILKQSDIESIEIDLEYASYDKIKIEDKKIIDALLIEAIRPKSLDEPKIKRIDKTTISANGKIYENNGYLFIGESLYQKIVNYAKEKQIKTIYKKLDYNNLDCIEHDLKKMDITSELKKILIEASQEEQPNNPQNTLNLYYLDLYKYENHDYTEVRVSINTTKELCNYAIHYFNNELLKKYDTIKKKGNFDFSSKDDKISYILKSKHNQISEYLNTEKGYKFLKEHQNDEVKREADARRIIIYTQQYPLQYNYFIWDVDAFINEIENYTKK